ncbi:MAG: hypothetical protein GX567_18275 [Clostridia bacterium]|nr:hypothetical protein [Clostridia bacterium]
MNRLKRTEYKVHFKNGQNHLINPEQGPLALLPEERHMSFYAMMALMSAGAIASWAFVTGNAVGVLIPVKYAICACLYGCTVSFAIHAYMVIQYNRWGACMTVIGRKTWGHIGIYIVILGIGYPATYGWGSMPIIMLGRSGATLVEDWGASGLGADWRVWSIIALIIGLFITYKGLKVIDKITKIAAPLVILIIISVIIVLAKDYGLSEVWNGMPKGVSDDPITLKHNYMIAVEIALGVGFSWPFGLAAWVKSSKTEHGAYSPSVYGSGVCWALCAVAPAMTATLSGLDDPVEALHSIAGPFAILWLIMLFFANVSSVMVNPTNLAIPLTSLFPKLGWRNAVIIQGLFIIAILWPVYYDAFGVAISFMGMAEAPIGAVWAVDCFINGKINLRHCYAKNAEERRNSAYWYFHGIRISAFAGWFGGMFFGLWMYNPYSGAIAVQGFFDLFGAMFPAAIVGVLIYLLVFYLYEKPRQISYVDMFQTIKEYHAEKLAKQQ